MKKPPAARLLEEIRKLIPSMVYFFLAFWLLGMTKTMILHEHHMMKTVLAHAAIGALVMAKVIFLMSLLPFSEPFPKTPILHNVLWKSLVSLFFAILIQFLEDAVPLLFHHEDLAPAVLTLRSLHFWMVQMWLVILILMFWLFKDLLRAIGNPAAREILFGIPQEETIETTI